jgi:hypothetical protein
MADMLIKKFIQHFIFWIFLILFAQAHAQDQAPTQKAPAQDKAHAKVRGIYLTQWNTYNTPFVTYLIKHAKASGINTFVIDMEEMPTDRFKANVALVQQNNIRYVARIIMFPDGGTKAQVANPDFWQRKYKLVQAAINLGAKEIQLDYIRYNTHQPPTPENAKRIYGIIQWYKNKLAGQNIPLQVDVFGIASYGESKYIGQNIKLFSQTVDAVCPMVYPSHYVPFAYHFQRPYETVYESLSLIQDQFDGQMPIKLYAYIELSNYHYSMTHTKTLAYIRAQLKAVQDAEADGWYAWSPHNRYDNLFKILEGSAN